MTPSPPPTGLLHQSAGTSNVLGSLPSRLVTEDTPPDMLAGSMDLRVTLPNGQTVKMSVERSTPMMDLLVHITTAHKVSPGGHVLQALGERGALPYKPSTPIGALDTWSICVVPRNQALASQQLLASANKRAPPKPLALQPQQPFEQTFRLQVRLPRNQLFVARLSPRTPLLDILEHVCREKNLEAAKYELRHPVNTDQPLQLSLSLADYRLTEVALVPRGSRAPTELSSSDIPALQTRSEETLLVSANSRQQRASNPASSTSTGSGGGGGGIFANMLKRTRSGGGGKEGSVSGDSLGGRSSSPARSDESAGRSVSPPAPRPLSQPQQPPLPTRHRKGRAPKPPAQATTSSVDKGNNNNAAANTEPAVVEAPADHILVISHSRNSSDSSGYHEASVLSESPDNHTNDSRRLESPSNGPARGKATKVSKSQQSKQFSRSMSNLSSEASTSTSQPPSQKLSSVHSMSTTSLSKKKRAPAPPPPPSTISEPRQPEPSPSVPPVSSIVLEPESTKETENLAEICPKDDEDDSAGEDDLDSAFQSVTDVLEEQLRAEEATALRKLAEDKATEEETERQRSSPEVSVEDAEELARSEAKKHEEWLRAEEERRKAEDERRRIEEERARLAQEREELARQKREQYALELELRERLQRELEEKQRAMQLEQRREIERLQKEQEELEQELKEKELEKLQRLKSKPALEIQLTEQEITDIPDWEYKLPAPPSAFRDKQVELTDMKQNEENEESSLWSTNSEEVATKNKINMMLETAKDSDEEMETRPKPPEVVELRVKPTVLCEPEPRSLSPPRITVLPLRSAHSLYSLIQADEDSLKMTQGERLGQNLRKTSSVADVSATAAPASSDLGDDEEQRLQQLQQQCIQWQEQLLTNQSVLQGHVSMPLQSLQVLREILPQMKQKLSEDASEKNDAVTLRSSTLPRTPRPVSASIVPLESGSSTTLDRRTTPAPVSQQRYRPPTVNLGTWSERPKSEVSIKQDSDYRIGFGQYQHTAARAPVVRSAEPKLKDTTNLIAGGAINRELVTRSNSWRVTPSTPLHKPSMVVIQNTTTTTTTTEQVRASNKPTVILRHQPLSLSDLPTQQRRYTTLVGINGAPQPNQQQQQANSNQQRINITQTSNPVVKGFKIETTAANPIPTPPPPVIRNVTQKRVNNPPPVQANNGATDRDHLMDAIRNFGGRSNLRKTRSMQL